ncbi:MAG: hypothetical protein AB7O97_22180 [Planctomycetota bacterium]
MTSSNAMRALLWRDRWWVLVWAVLGAAGLAMGAADGGFGVTWVLPPHRGDVLFHVAWSLGLGLGLFAAFWDVLLGTQDQLAHRPVSAARRAVARQLAVLLVLAGWLVLTPLLSFVVELAFGRLAWLFALGNVGWFAALLAPAVSAAAVGLWAGTLPCAVLLRLWIAVGVEYLALVAIGFAVGREGGFALFVLLHVALAAVLLWLTVRNAGVAADADRPWDARVRRTSGAIGLAGFVGSGALLLALWGSEQMATLANASPSIEALPQGVGLVANLDRQGYQEVVVDADHRPVGEPLARDVRTERLWNRYRVGRTRDPEIGAPRPADLRSEHGLVLWNGALHVLRSRWDEAPRHLVLHKPDGAPFAAQARFVDVRSEGRREHAICEIGARQLWMLDRASRELVPLALPDGDTLVGVAYAQMDQRDPQRRIETQLGAYELRADSEIVFRGERGVYRIADGEFVPALPWQVVAAQKDKDAEYTIEVVDTDPMAPHVQVRRGDELVFDHVFAVRTGAEWAAFAPRLVMAAAMPPLLQLASFASPALAADERGIGLLDPLLRGRRHAWLLLASCAVGVGCAFAGVRRLRRLGADANTRRLWAVWITLTGPLGLVASIVAERPRAYAAASADESAAAPPPRIQSPLSVQTRSA